MNCALYVLLGVFPWLAEVNAFPNQHKRHHRDPRSTYASLEIEMISVATEPTEQIETEPTEQARDMTADDADTTSTPDDNSANNVDIYSLTYDENMMDKKSAPYDNDSYQEQSGYIEINDRYHKRKLKLGASAEPRGSTDRGYKMNLLLQDQPNWLSTTKCTMGVNETTQNMDESAPPEEETSPEPEDPEYTQTNTNATQSVEEVTTPVPTDDLPQSTEPYESPPPPVSAERFLDDV